MHFFNELNQIIQLDQPRISASACPPSTSLSDYRLRIISVMTTLVVHNKQMYSYLPFKGKHGSASSMQGFTLHERQYILECRNAFVTGKYNANWGSLEHALTDKKASTCTVHVQ